MANEAPTQSDQEIKAEVERFLVDVPRKVIDEGTYRRAKTSLPQLKRAEDKVIAFFADMKAAAWSTHRKICERESSQLRPIQDLRKAINAEVYAFERAERERQRQEELRLAEERRKEEQERLLREAEQLEAIGQPEIADQVLEQAVAAPAPVVSAPSRIIDVAGVSKPRENWQFGYAGVSPELKWQDLTDEQRRHARQLLPREYMQPDESAIGSEVRANKSATKIPGIVVYDAGTLATRG